MNNLSETDPNAANQFNVETLKTECAQNKETLSKREYLNFCKNNLLTAIHLQSLPVINLLVNELRDNLTDYQKDDFLFAAAKSGRIGVFLFIMMNDFYHPRHEVIVGEDYNTTYAIPGFKIDVRMQLTDNKEFNFWLSTMFPEKEMCSTLSLHQELLYPQLKEQLYAAISRHNTRTLLLIFATWLHHYTRYSQIDSNRLCRKLHVLW